MFETKKTGREREKGEGKRERGRGDERRREILLTQVFPFPRYTHLYADTDTWPLVPTEARSVSGSGVNWHSRPMRRLSLFTTISPPPIEGQCRNNGLHIIYKRVLQVDFKRTPPPPVRLRVKLFRERRESGVSAVCCTAQLKA